MALTMQAQKIGRSVGPIRGFVVVAIRLQTTATMFPFVPRALVFPLVIVEAHEAKVEATEKPFERREFLFINTMVCPGMDVLVGHVPSRPPDRETFF